MFALLLTTAFALSWENTTAPHPERAPWSKAVVESIDTNYNKFIQAKDWSSFCPRFQLLDKAQKINAMAEFVVAVAYYESGYNSLARMREDLGTDKVTGQQVMSEGLLQLSYGDKLWAPWCEFDWARDRHLPISTRRSILEPTKNLRCGLGIMANQINRHSSVVVRHPKSYWSVIADGHKNQKIFKIKQRVKAKAKGCM